MKNPPHFPNFATAFRTVALAFAITASAAQPSFAQDTLAVGTTAGPVIGTQINGIQSWLGMPYAAPPVGALRWQPPQAVTPWTIPIKANTLSSSCAQNADLGVFARAGGNEDCLYLNVYRGLASMQAGRKLPVFVWLHGGALQVGQGGDYDPSKLAGHGGSLVVTLNYRLGVFGFFANTALDANSRHSGNYGLQDQQAALRWVKQNIAAFGGDPDNVTIAGESSGGNSVMAHIASPSSAGLFQQGVAMSGGGIMTRHPAFGAPRPLEVARKVGDSFVKAVGCEGKGVECLRSLSTKRILDAQAPYALNEFIIDGTVLPIHPSDAYRTGRVNRVTLIHGNTRDEGTFFVALPEVLNAKALTEAEYPEWLERQYGTALAPQVLRQYPVERYNSPSEAFAAAATDSMFACTGRAMSQALADKMPVYAYEFADRTAPSYVGPTTFPLMAAHTFELPYVFPGFRGVGDTLVKLNVMQEKLSDEMVGHFASAAQMASREAQWPRFDAKADNVMTFVLPEAKVVSNRFADAHHCTFWDRTGTY